MSISRRQGGRHYVLPLPSDIQVRSRSYGLDNLTPIMWQKIGNIALEASDSSVFLGKPNLPNGVIAGAKNLSRRSTPCSVAKKDVHGRDDHGHDDSTKPAPSCQLVRRLELY